MNAKLKEIHIDALSKFEKIQEASKEEREQALEDRRFCTISGAQWEGDLAEQYANKPKFEVNKVHLSVIRIINEYRNNRITVDFSPKTKAQDQLAELANSMYRADENDSLADEAYDNAFEEAVQGGMGAWRLRADYEDEYDEDNDKQRIRIEPIFDADISVFFDIDAKRADKSDAKYCYLISSMTPEAYKEKYNDDPTSWPTDTYDKERFDWATNDAVFVAEYYAVEEKKLTRVYFETITGEEEVYWLSDLDDEKMESIQSIGHIETKRRKIKRRRVHKYILSGGGVLEDCGYIAGKEIPIVPCYGKRWFIENIERFMGHVRLAKDAQRLKNMQLSELAEHSALDSREKPILTPEQIAGHDKMWSEDNIKRYPYLLINPLTNEEGMTVAQGPIAYTKPSIVPPALATLLQLTEEDMRDILGRSDTGEKVQSNLSGKAVELIQNRLDMQSFIYMSNFANALKRCGQIWISMAKDVYIEDEREVKVISEDDDVDTKKIRIRTVDNNGEIVIDNDLDSTDFDVNVDIGPSSSSKRESIVRQATALLQYTTDPETQNILQSFAMMNMEGDGMRAMREFFRKKLVRMGVEAPTEEDMQEMQMEQGGPTPNDQYLLAEAERAQAEAAKNRADTIETIANSELKKAQAAQIQFEIMQAQKGPPAQEAPMAPPSRDDEFKEAEIKANAIKTRRELDMKEREIDLKEQDLLLKMQEQELKAQEQTAKLAEIGFKIMGEKQGDMNAKDGHNAAVEMAAMVAEAVQGLKVSLDAQEKDRKEALEIIKKPKSIKRDDDGNLIGIE